MDRFITQVEGKWLLNAGGESREGSYSFNPATGTLVDADGTVVGRFSCDPISERPLPLSLDAPGDQPIECIDIANSEIMAEIQNPTNEGAYFVLPSQLNGAEYPAPMHIVEHIKDYKSDNTGGPRGQLAVHPAAGQFVLDNAASDRLPGGINAVDQILEAGGGFHLRNGYLEMPLPETREESSKILELFRSRLHLLRPLVMAGVPACGLSPSKREFSSTAHKVNLVYASAVPVDA